MVVGAGAVDRYLSEQEVRRLVGEALNALAVDGRRVLVIVPDGTRTVPLPLMIEIIEAHLRPRTAALDYLVALGTHQPLTDQQLSALIGRPVSEGNAAPGHVFNHRWDDPDGLVTLGTIPASETAALTDGRLTRDIPVALNRLVLAYDHLLICGPVFPHEVVGFSGGTKYLVPGIAAADIINLTHWLGALVTSSVVIGTADTPVRAVIDRAAAMVDRPVTCVALVVSHEGTHGVYVGAPQDAWRQAAMLAARTHIRWVDRPFMRVLAVMPSMYTDLWTAAKGVYKTEPAVADGGEVVIYAPHVTEVSYTHGPLIDEIGYHCRDYFLAQWDRFGRYPGGVLAHSTHVRGLGTYDRARGIERLRIRVTLATGIPRERCARLNLGYLDPSAVRIDEWRGCEEQGVVVIPRAGEHLYRLGTALAVALETR